MDNDNNNDNDNDNNNNNNRTITLPFAHVRGVIIMAKVVNHEN